MRLSLVLLAAAFTALASSDAIPASTSAIGTKSAGPGDAVQDADLASRFLRGNPVDYESDDLDGSEDDEEEEERGLENLATTSKKLKELSPKVDELDDAAKAAATKAAVGKNPNKLTPFGLHKGPVTDAALVRARVGREKQRYSDDGRRLLSCIVISDPSKGRDGEVLLISSSRTEGRWILPKGGWEMDESIWASARREALEEAGVKGRITRPLGKLEFSSDKPNKADQKYRYYGFEMRATKILKTWAEDSRQRRWVSYDQAKTLLKDPQMKDMVNRAQTAKAHRMEKLMEAAA
ncbi:Nudix hydrolase 3 [Phytophthora boehmeriae]|uniref:RxLR effector protein n=1 Tax=Phytophthora boehmeriae TaxID=109152 RepID=A0A8T1W9C2_9STRA|nr:Nudix hydrolase 3 [Phytophthora boehmeriae]